jgi:hypothetical protein
VFRIWAPGGCGGRPHSGSTRPVTAQAVQFHLRNATAWANDRTAEDLAGQVDPAFVRGPAALAAVR